MVTIVRKAYTILDADLEASTVEKMLQLWDIEYTYSVVENPKDVFLLTFVLCDQKKKETC